MKKIDLGQTSAVLANIGVSAGVVFLAIEVRQNNTELSAQSRFNYYQNRLDGQRLLMEVDGLATFRVENFDENSDAQ